MADAGAACCAAETAVRQEGHLEPHAGDNGGGIEHFSHARAAFGAFVADDNDVAILHFFGDNGVDSVFFGVKAFGWASEVQHIRRHGAFFDYRSIRR